MTDVRYDFNCARVGSGFCNLMSILRLYVALCMISPVLVWDFDVRTLFIGCAIKTYYDRTFDLNGMIQSYTS